MSLWQRLGAAVREPDHVQVPVPVADAARAALNAVLYGDPTDADYKALDALDDALDDALFAGFMHDGPGEVNAPWRVRLRRLRPHLRTNWR